MAIRDWFSPKPCKVCPTCEAYRNMIQVLKDQEAFLQSLVTDLQLALLKSTRLAPITGPHKTERAPSEPMSTMPPMWAEVKRKMEDKHRRKPEDDKAAEWQGKIDKLEREAGLTS